MKSPYRWMKAICWIVATLSASSAWAGKEGGNGGNVLRTPDGLLHVLDLVEAGYHFDQGLPIYVYDPGMAQSVEMVLHSYHPIPADTKKTLAYVLSSMPSAQAKALLAGLMAYSLNFVQGPLSHIDDVDSALSYDPKDLVQAAVRTRYTIEIRQEIWDQLSSVDRAALLLHEVVYAYMIPEEYTDPASGQKYLAQSSSVARQLVGGVFTAHYQGTNFQGPDFAYYNRDGKPISGATLPQRDRPYANDLLFEIGGSDANGLTFTYGPRLRVRSAEEQLRNEDGWVLDSKWTLDPSQGGTNADTAKEYADQIHVWCDPSTRLNLDGKMSDLRVDAFAEAFNAQFAEYAGKSGPMIYLKGQTHEQAIALSGVPASLSPTACEKRLKEVLESEAQAITNLRHLAGP